MKDHPYLDYLVLLAIALASLVGINQYHYGMWNQFVSIPWLLDLMDPGLYPHDQLVEQRNASPSFFLSGIKLFKVFTGLGMAWAHFILYCFVLISSIFSFYQLGRSFYSDRRAGILTAVLLAFAFPVIGDVQTWDSLLMERTMALPLLVFSLSQLIRGKYLGAILLQGLAFNIHPLSALFLIFPSAFALFFSEGFRLKHLAYATFLLFLLSPILYLRSTHPGSESMVSFSEQWMAVMQIRNAHHALPSAYPFLIWLKSSMLILFFCLILFKASWPEGIPAKLKGLALGFLLMLITGWIFTDLFPIKIIIQLQFFRSFLFLILLSIAMWAAQLFHKPRPFYYLLFLLLVFQFVQVDFAKTVGFIGLSLFAWFLYRFFEKYWWKSILLSAAFLLLGGAAWYLRGGLDIERGIQSAEWYETQEWFAQETAKDALAIVPPSELGFRVFSQRSSYGDWFDGTKAFFSEAYARHWWEHMQKLGAHNPDSLELAFRSLPLSQFRAIAAEEEQHHSEIYLVAFADQKLKGQAVYSNRKYQVYRLDPF